MEPVSVVSDICPVTPLENALRVRGGGAGYEGDFIAHYLSRVLYPEHLTRTGQFVLGEPLNGRNRRSRNRLRTVAELFNEIVDPTLDDDNEPSCSAIEALSRQECFVNGALAQHALALLARLFRYGEISYHGAFVDVGTARSTPLPIDPTVWRLLRKRKARAAAGMKATAA